MTVVSKSAKIKFQTFGCNSDENENYSKLSKHFSNCVVGFKMIFPTTCFEPLGSFLVKVTIVDLTLTDTLRFLYFIKSNETQNLITY